MRLNHLVPLFRSMDAAEHGRQRDEQGFSHEAVMKEYQILRRAVERDFGYWCVRFSVERTAPPGIFCLHMTDETKEPETFAAGEYVCPECGHDLLIHARQRDEVVQQVIVSRWYADGSPANGAVIDEMTVEECDIAYPTIVCGVCAAVVERAVPKVVEGP